MKIKKADFQKSVEFARAWPKSVDFYTTCRFLEEQAAQNLEPNFPAWTKSVYGCSVSIYPGRGFFVSKLSSLLLDIAVCTALKKAGFDSPCHTYGDVVEGKLWEIPPAAVLKFQKEHHKEILEWQEKKSVNNFLDNPDYEKRWGKRETA